MRSVKKQTESNYARSASAKHFRRTASLLGMVFSLLFTAALCLQIFFPDIAYNIFKVKSYIISYTGSMEPMLSYYDMIFVKKYDINELKKGDIITFSARILTSDGSIVITHKIEEIFIEKNTGKRFIQTRGIARDDVDTVFVTEDGADGTNRLIGKYLCKSAVLGRFAGFISSKYAILAGIFILSGSAIIWLIIRTGNVYQEENREN